MREYLTIFLVAVAITYLLCVVAREIALRLGAVAKVRQRDMHEVPVPYLARRGRSKVTGTVKGTMRAVADQRRMLREFG